MKRYFADTFYFLAIMNPADAAHRCAVEASRASDVDVVTTAWVMTETADALAKRPLRRLLESLLQSIESDPQVLIVPPTEQLFQRGIALFRARRASTPAPPLAPTA